tara:strand:- start:1039 stop:1314 length:276 start_codon:yes stop_codon:yes gene_type:complete
MYVENAKSLALSALAFILSEDDLRDRFLALSGMDADDMRKRIEETDFMASILEFLLSHEPDLLAYSEHSNENPEHIIVAWRALGGGVGHEW